MNLNSDYLYQSNMDSSNNFNSKENMDEKMYNYTSFLCLFYKNLQAAIKIVSITYYIYM